MFCLCDKFGKSSFFRSCYNLLIDIRVLVKMTVWKALSRCLCVPFLCMARFLTSSATFKKKADCILKYVWFLSFILFLFLLLLYAFWTLIVSYIDTFLNVHLFHAALSSFLNLFISYNQRRDIARKINRHFYLINCF